jgi:hypothetical protein
MNANNPIILDESLTSSETPNNNCHNYILFESVLPEDTTTASKPLEGSENINERLEKSSKAVMKVTNNPEMSKTNQTVLIVWPQSVNF